MLRRLSILGTVTVMSLSCGGLQRTSGGGTWEFNEVLLRLFPEPDLKKANEGGDNYFLAPNATVQFHAKLLDGTNVNLDGQADWLLDLGLITDGSSGVISSTGLYTAPPGEKRLSLSIKPKAGAPKYSGFAWLIITPFPTIESFEATPALVSAGQAVQLLGRFSGVYSQGWYGTARILSGTEVVSPSVQSGAPITVMPTVTTTYTLEVANPAGSTVTKNLTVEVRAP